MEWLIASAILFVVAIIGAFAFIMAIVAKQSQCMNCNKKFALEELEKTELSREKCSKIEELKTRNKNGDVTGTRQVRRYGEKIKYQVTYKCKYCNHKTTKIEDREQYL